MIPGRPISRLSRALQLSGRAFETQLQLLRATFPAERSSGLSLPGNRGSELRGLGPF